MCWPRTWIRTWIPKSRTPGIQFRVYLQVTIRGAGLVPSADSGYQLPGDDPLFESEPLRKPRDLSGDAIGRQFDDQRRDRSECADLATEVIEHLVPAHQFDVDRELDPQSRAL